VTGDWPGAWMTHEDGFAYGEAMGAASAILAIRKLAAKSTPEQQVALKTLELGLATRDTLEALAYLEKSTRGAR